MTGIRWADWIRPGDTVVDVGANIGEYTGAFLEAGASVIAFEPDAGARAQLQARHPRAEIRAEAIGPWDGETVFYACETTTASSRLETAPAELKTTRTTAQMVTLDQALAGRVVNGIKVDAQGDDGWVLAGGKQTLAQMPIGSWLLYELWPHGLRTAAFDLDQLVPLCQGWRVVAWGKACSGTTHTLPEILAHVRGWKDGMHTNVLLRKQMN